eukprot:403367210
MIKSNKSSRLKSKHIKTVHLEGVIKQRSLANLLKIQTSPQVNYPKGQSVKVNDYIEGKINEEIFSGDDSAINHKYALAQNIQKHTFDFSVQELRTDKLVQHQTSTNFTNQIDSSIHIKQLREPAIQFLGFKVNRQLGDLNSAVNLSKERIAQANLKSKRETLIRYNINNRKNRQFETFDQQAPGSNSTFLSQTFDATQHTDSHKNKKSFGLSSQDLPSQDYIRGQLNEYEENQNTNLKTFSNSRPQYIQPCGEINNQGPTIPKIKNHMIDYRHKQSDNQLSSHRQSRETLVQNRLLTRKGGQASYRIVSHEPQHSQQFQKNIKQTIMATQGNERMYMSIDEIPKVLKHCVFQASKSYKQGINNLNIPSDPIQPTQQISHRNCVSNHVNMNGAQIGMQNQEVMQLNTSYLINDIKHPQMEQCSTISTTKFGSKSRKHQYVKRYWGEQAEDILHQKECEKYKNYLTIQPFNTTYSSFQDGGRGVLSLEKMSGRRNNLFGITSPTGVDNFDQEKSTQNEENLLNLAKNMKAEGGKFNIEKNQSKQKVSLQAQLQPLNYNIQDLRYHTLKIRDSIGHIHEKANGLIHQYLTKFEIRDKIP